MQITRTGKIKLVTDFNYGAQFSVEIEEGEHTRINGWLGTHNDIGQLEFLVKCRDEFTKMIAKLETGELKELKKPKKWFEFWK